MVETKRITAIELRESAPGLWTSKVTEGWGAGLNSAGKSPKVALENLERVIDMVRREDPERGLAEDEAEEYPEPEALQFYVCVNCGKTGQWGAGWSWVGQAGSMRPACCS